MKNPIGNILRSAVRKENEPLNILTFCTHEPYEEALCKTGHNFYAFRHEAVGRDWNHTCRQLPQNYHLLDKRKNENQIPNHIDFDLVLSNTRFGQFSLGEQLSKHLHICHVNMEHTLPLPGWPIEYLQEIKKRKADINLFISEYNREMWMWQENEAGFIYHGIDANLYSPSENIKRENYCLTCCNDFINRDAFCGYNLWNKVTKGLNRKVIGNTPGLSEGTKNIEELINEYRKAQIYINTSVISPIPMSLLEAMACECAILTTATCVIPEFIEHGVNGYITNDENKMRKYLIELLNEPELCKELGKNARKTIFERWNLQKFVNNWNDIFYRATNTPRLF